MGIILLWQKGEITIWVRQLDSAVETGTLHPEQTVVENIRM